MERGFECPLGTINQASCVFGSSYDMRAFLIMDVAYHTRLLLRKIRLKNAMSWYETKLVLRFVN